MGRKESNLFDCLMHSIESWGVSSIYAKKANSNFDVFFSGAAAEKENNSDASDVEPLSPQNIPRRKGNKRRLNSLQSPLALNNPPV